MKFSHFFVVGPHDSVIYEYGGSDSDGVQLMRQFFAYSSLDIIDDTVWAKGDFYLNRIDRPSSEQLYISAYVGLSPVKLILMHDNDQGDNVRLFFTEAYNIIAKYLINPFSEPAKDVSGSNFHEALISIYKKYG
ncbi:trafficking protein particle complex 2 [Strigomonas culicis]|nr:trafficking protein particle complex 2 [Strigomonas culicis]|eukprot:EPY33666.1 trafficking protein particle complex 2 [Strigomonas culicis]